MTFVRYIDTETGEPLADDIGRCDREINCGYHKKPKDFFAEGNAKPAKGYWFPKKEFKQPARPSGFSTISPEIVEHSMELACFNNFNVWLRERFDSRLALEATSPGSTRSRASGTSICANAFSVFTSSLPTRRPSQSLRQKRRQLSPACSFRTCCSWPPAFLFGTPGRFCDANPPRRDDFLCARGAFAG